MEISEVLCVPERLDALVDHTPTPSGSREDFLLRKSCSRDARLLEKKRRRTVHLMAGEAFVKKSRLAPQEQFVKLSSSTDSSLNWAEVSATGEWTFEQIGAFSCNSSSPDVISSIDYDERNKLIATGGLARKVRICSYEALTAVDSTSSWTDIFTTICMPAKLSSLKWRLGSSQVIGCGDYDGSVTEWDVERGVSVSERYDHSGGTVWSIDYSRDSQDLLASASSDGTVRFWGNNVEASVGLISSPRGNSMCSVEFNQWNPHEVAVGCADAKVYVYDLRNLSSAVLDLVGHERSVGYVRWLGNHSLVSSSPDGTIRLWDLHLSKDEACRRTFRHHTNTRNFVGLAVTDARFIASGSETNEVFVYGTSNDRPIFQQEFSRAMDDKPFVASVCWTRQQDHVSLISANSEGSLQVTKVLSTACVV